MILFFLHSLSLNFLSLRRGGGGGGGGSRRWVLLESPSTASSGPERKSREGERSDGFVGCAVRQNCKRLFVGSYSIPCHSLSSPSPSFLSLLGFVYLFFFTFTIFCSYVVCPNCFFFWFAASQKLGYLELMWRVHCFFFNIYGRGFFSRYPFCYFYLHFCFLCSNYFWVLIHHDLWMFGFDIFVDWGIKVESFAEFGICMLYSDCRKFVGFYFM